ncbi:hypothetical protein U9M48_020519 [Paspalum notatum var. saurae]|uniref:Uncharacterized protein n=1 Tax=Paspalum notatum var. saurae TaxID=547442 RepID=A0AAQ3TEF8_PASNO
MHCRGREVVEMERIGSQRRAVWSWSGQVVPQSHSTGHSLAAPRVDGVDRERFTLRQLEHVRREMVGRRRARRACAHRGCSGRN